MKSYERTLHVSLDPATDDRWEFDLDGSRTQLWIWRRVDSRGCVLDRSRPFASCLAAVRDARAHGFGGRADIVRPAPQPVQRRR
jgi:hypothetical protein